MADPAPVSGDARGHEQRRSPRYLTLATAQIAAAAGVLDCAVLNVSAGGACLLVNDAAAVPEVFDLLVDPERFRIRCALAWRTRHHVGVAFLPTESDAPPPPAPWPRLALLGETNSTGSMQ
ncbi:PilZ domain-containing protein [Rhodoplanes roseus]|uniref:PilZ domain-containing protein n=1 Tax=Rhodoplanes roseus TaxID=29409 RepID=A0A327KPN0_9BRAD|nr:PilZ domain-containing protein [Rhodoplanes roseus]RAI39325.1 hypothetical protein CH341_26095 [Rhodoplanes roseus]